MATISFRMLTVCLFVAVILNCSNYMFMRFYTDSNGHRISKYYYPKTESGVEVDRSLIQTDWPADFPCSGEVASTANAQEMNKDNQSLSSSPDYNTPNDETHYCPELPPGLGPILDSDSEMSLLDFESKFGGDLKFGGIYHPTTCESRHSVAIIIAYRGCRRYLATFLFVLHPLLIKQQLDYQVFVIEQSNNTQLFNRGKLLNVGVTEAQKHRKSKWSCLILHEAHIVPTDARNLYRCSWYPRQLAVYVERENKPPYVPKFGGAVAITPEQYSKANGLSNNYWGNDADFEDFYNRILLANYFIENGVQALGKYTTLKKYSGAERIKSEYMETVSPLYLLDGLTSLSYTVDSFELRRMYTYIKVNIDETIIITNTTTTSRDKLLNPATSSTTNVMTATKVT